MNKQIIKQVRLYTNQDETMTVAFFNHGRYFIFRATNSSVSSIDLAVDTLFCKHTTSNIIKLSDYRASLEETKAVS